jgi:hypothetical protein
MSTLLAKNAEVLVTMDGQRRELKNAGIYAEEGFIKLGTRGKNEEGEVARRTRGETEDFVHREEVG